MIIIFFRSVRLGIYLVSGRSFIEFTLLTGCDLQADFKRFPRVGLRHLKNNNLATKSRLVKDSDVRSVLQMSRESAHMVRSKFNRGRAINHSLLPHGNLCTRYSCSGWIDYYPREIL